MGLPSAYAPYAPPIPPAYVPPVPQLTREQEVDALRDQVKMMQENIKAAQERIEELDKEKDGYFISHLLMRGGGNDANLE